MSDILRIRTLTDRFFDGTTTLEEEHELYDYYRREQALPADLAQLRQLFLDFAAVQFGDEQALNVNVNKPRRWLRRHCGVAEQRSAGRRGMCGLYLWQAHH